MADRRIHVVQFFSVILVVTVGLFVLNSDLLEPKVDFNSPTPVTAIPELKAKSFGFYNYLKANEIIFSN